MLKHFTRTGDNHLSKMHGNLLTSAVLPTDIDTRDACPNISSPERYMENTLSALFACTLDQDTH